MKMSREAKFRQHIYRKTARDFPILDNAICADCKKAAGVVRHHIDGSVLNNVHDNIAVLCHRCHGEISGAQVKNKERTTVRCQVPDDWQPEKRGRPRGISGEQLEELRGMLPLRYGKQTELAQRWGVDRTTLCRELRKIRDVQQLKRSHQEGKNGRKSWNGKGDENG